MRHLKAILDSGCTRCVISPEVVKKLGLRRLKIPIAFCQLHGSVAGEGPAHFVTKLVEMGIGSHTETLSFIMVPGMLTYMAS